MIRLFILKIIVQSKYIFILFRIIKYYYYNFLDFLKYWGVNIMIIALDESEERVLHALLEEVSGDIMIRLDRLGFITQTSANIGELGLHLATVLLPPHH
jgi:hypothetical protein